MKSGDDLITEKSTNNITIEKKTTLEEFKKLADSEPEKLFFESHKIIDNTKLLKFSQNARIGEFIEENNENTVTINSPEEDGEERRRVKVNFRWAGRGCSNSVGICVMIPIGPRRISFEDSKELNFPVIKIKDKIAYITPLTDDNGLTKDGYLPLYLDVSFDNFTLKAGIYKAKFNEITRKFTIPVDLK
ncbi:MAG: hypothetical protein KA327_06795 [Pseudarcicella sp.]|nr:hypothetical protein [Pseudarcicella sp.]